MGGEGLISGLAYGLFSSKSGPAYTVVLKFSSLKTCSHKFLRSDKVNPSLTPPYTGPHLVIDRNDKNFFIDVNGKHTTVSIDYVKLAYHLPDDITHIPSLSLPVSAPFPQCFNQTSTTKSGRKVRFPKHLVTDYIP
ncbi:hypothetical protein X975_02326, partial [Stegodyphus mimosarum]